MKKLITTLLLIASISGYAQITLENTYVNGGISAERLRLIKLSSSGYKYCVNDTSTIRLYNLNHTLFRTINIPPGAFMSTVSVFYVSEELFNTNPADIEYLLSYYNLGITHFRIYNETGTVLLARDSVALSSSTSAFEYEPSIAYTPSGWKMTISQSVYGNDAYVYSLPGFLPCHDCTNGVITSMVTENGDLKSSNVSNYPNPNNGQTTIEYTLPQGTTTADLVFYNTTGQEIKRFKVTDTFHDIVISTADLDAGTYYYQLQTTSGYKAGKKMVVIK